jgi:hypothetical protein
VRGGLNDRPAQDGALADAGLALEQETSRPGCEGSEEASHAQKFLVPSEDLFRHVHPPRAPVGTKPYTGPMQFI